MISTGVDLRFLDRISTFFCKSVPCVNVAVSGTSFVFVSVPAGVPVMSDVFASSILNVPDFSVTPVILICVKINQIIIEISQMNIKNIKKIVFKHSDETSKVVVKEVIIF